MKHLVYLVPCLLCFGYFAGAFIVAVSALQRRVLEALDADDEEIAAAALAEGVLWPFIAWAMVTRRGDGNV